MSLKFFKIFIYTDRMRKVTGIRDGNEISELPLKQRFLATAKAEGVTM